MPKEEESQRAEMSPSSALFQLVTAHYLSHAIYVAAKLGIADLIGQGPQHYSDLAEKTGTHGPSLNRLMRLLASAGVLTDEGNGYFSLTPTGKYLRTEIPGSRRAVAMVFAGPKAQHAWSDLLYSVQTGEPAFDHVFGMDGFQFFAQHPEEGAIFNEAMAGGHAWAFSEVAKTYDFSPFHTVVDLGGGRGGFLTAILKANPALRGILFERPHVAEGARAEIAAAGLARRCDVLAGSFFDSVPTGGDMYILKSVLHGWDDARCRAILRNCHQVMPRKGKLLIVELIFPHRVDQSGASRMAAGSDVNVLVNTTGQERTEEEFQALLESAGFRLARIIPTRTASSVIEGHPI